MRKGWTVFFLIQINSLIVSSQTAAKMQYLKYEIAIAALGAAGILFGFISLIHITTLFVMVAQGFLRLYGSYGAYDMCVFESDVHCFKNVAINAVYQIVVACVTLWFVMFIVILCSMIRLRK